MFKWFQINGLLFFFLFFFFKTFLIIAIIMQTSSFLEEGRELHINVPQIINLIKDLLFQSPNRSVRSSDDAIIGHHDGAFHI